MIKCSLFHCMLFSLACNTPNQKNIADSKDSIVSSTTMVNSFKDTLQIASEDNNISATITTKKDTLSSIESRFFSLIAEENEFFLFSKEVERTYSADGKILLSKMLFSKKALADGGYKSIEVFLYGNIADRVCIQYSYNMGLASYGYGSVIGDDINSYLHTIKSCGVSSCIIQVFDTGKKIFEKEDAN